MSGCVCPTTAANVPTSRIKNNLFWCHEQKWNIPDVFFVARKTAESGTTSCQNYPVLSPWSAAECLDVFLKTCSFVARDMAVKMSHLLKSIQFSWHNHSWKISWCCIKYPVLLQQQWLENNLKSLLKYLGFFSPRLRLWMSRYRIKMLSF